MQRIHFGGDYHPELWPEEVWHEDLRLMRQARVTLVTLGVFSWAKAEPRSGRYAFGWLDRLLDLLADAGVQVCLATMTASPPPWLSAAHPEVLPQTADGRRLSPGSRQHYCPSSPVYRGHAVRLVEQLAVRYAHHPALTMWHLGDAYGRHVRQCFCDVSAEDFRLWLSDRYGTVEALNDAWSTAFWSQSYGELAEVRPPRAAPAVTNPAQRLDYHRFSSDALLACQLAEREVLERITPSVPVTTTFLPLHKAVDQFAWAAHEDVVSLGRHHDPQDPDDPDDRYDPDSRTAAALSFDLVRSAGGGAPWMLREQTPGAVGRGPGGAPKPPGAMRLRSWQAVAQGADAVLFAQWRQPRGGAEKLHPAMVPHGGTDTRVFREVTALGAEFAAVPQLAGTRAVPAEAALVQDWNSWWALELGTHPSTALRQTERMLDHYRPLSEAGVPCDIVPPGRELSRYPLVVVPNLYLLSEENAARLTAYVRGGGRLLVSFFTGIVDGCDRVHPGGHPAPLREVLGLRVEEFQPLEEGAEVPVRGKATGPARGGLWSEAIDLTGAEAKAVFDAGPSAGRPAVTRHPYGDGAAWYVGTRLDPAAMRRVLDAVCREAGVRPLVPALPEGVQATAREAADGTRYVFLLHHGEEPCEVELPERMTDLLAPDAAPAARIPLAPQGVAVLRRP